MFQDKVTNHLMESSWALFCDLRSKESLFEFSSSHDVLLKIIILKFASLRTSLCQISTFSLLFPSYDGNETGLHVAEEHSYQVYQLYRRDVLLFDGINFFGRRGDFEMRFWTITSFDGFASSSFVHPVL